MHAYSLQFRPSAYSIEIGTESWNSFTRSGMAAKPRSPFFKFPVSIWVYSIISFDLNNEKLYIWEFGIMGN